MLQGDRVYSSMLQDSGKSLTLASTGIASPLARPTISSCRLLVKPFTSGISQRQSVSQRQALQQSSTRQEKLQARALMNGGNIQSLRGHSLSAVLLANLSHADGAGLYRIFISLQTSIHCAKYVSVARAMSPVSSFLSSRLTANEQARRAMAQFRTLRGVYMQSVHAECMSLLC